ncbi:MAG TPA: class I SAM-dependent methyltransferase [Candidatus Methanofastidiosa archaeon]|nr:class I SAM-dependent methyltransferase [Candidatus Methanofastidiosa archaeon]
MPSKEFLSEITDLYRRGPVLEFLRFCEEEDMEKRVLDCGAGGPVPPLALFAMHGYETHGIDISGKAVSASREFGKRHGMDLNIGPGDMRDIKFPDGHFSFVYSYNTIFHMPKREIYLSIGEMARVLKPGGLMFFNLLSVDDEGYGTGTEQGPGEFEEDWYGEKSLHAYFEDEEADTHLGDTVMVEKQERKGTLWIEGDQIRYAYIDYFLRKPK